MQPTGSAPPAAPAQLKKQWSRPAIVTMQLRDARGSDAGPLCDRYGSLSHGSYCGK
jgi:hypothetical protein